MQRKYQALREEEARQERVKAQELFEFEAQNRWCKVPIWIRYQA